MNAKRIFSLLALSVFVPAFAQEVPAPAVPTPAAAQSAATPAKSKFITDRTPTEAEPIKFFRALVSWNVKSISLSWDCDQEVFQSLSVTDKQLSEMVKSDIDTVATGELKKTTTGGSYKITDSKKVGARMGGSFNFSRALIPSRIFNFNIGGDTSWERASTSVSEGGNKSEESNENKRVKSDSSRVAAIVEAISQYTSKTRISKLNLVAEIEFFNNTGEMVLMDELLVPIFADGSKLGDAYEETKKVRHIRYRWGKPITINFRCDLDSTRSRSLSSGNASAALEQSTGTIKTSSGIDILCELARDNRLYLVSNDNVGEFHFRMTEKPHTVRELVDAFNKQCSRNIDSAPLITYDKDSKFYLKSAGGNASGDDGFWCIRSVDGNETLALDAEIYPTDNFIIYKAYPQPEWVEVAAKAGDASAQYWLGHCYYRGVGVPEDVAEAVKWFQKSAEQGNARAQCALGDCFKFGKGVEKNPAKAFAWFQKSADAGNPDAQYRLGLCCFLGYGAETNAVLAEENFLKAAERNNAEAQYLLGLLYLDGGDGVKRDLKAAEKWIRRSAVFGHPEAQKCVKELYSQPKAVIPEAPKS